MKKISFLFGALVIGSLVNAQTVSTGTSSQTPGDISKVITFRELDHDFGTIPYGKPVEYTVDMKNISNDSVTISNVQVGCGCTTPKWKPGPYAPGESFSITLGFNGYTENNFQKVVWIYFTNGMNQLLRFHGVTYKAPDKPAPTNDGVKQLQSAGGNY